MKRILITGHSGFLGRIIRNHLKEDEVITLGRKDADYTCDLESTIPEFNHSFDLVIHCAGKAHVVPKNVKQHREFYNVNTHGTINLLSGLDKLTRKPHAFVFISTVAVYGLDSGDNINEQTPLNAVDPYGHSKILAEKEIIRWGEENKVTISILRLPLIVGENPPGNLKSMINGIKKGLYFNIAGGKARKSMVLADDVAKFIHKVSDIGGTYNLTDGYHPSFYELSKCIGSQIGRENILSIPKSVAYFLALLGNLLGSKSPINSRKYNKIVSDLVFDDSFARKNANWNPSPVLENFKLL